MKNQMNVYWDRRKGPDFWSKLVKWVGYLVWVITIVIIMLADKARPPVETFFDRYFSIQLRQSWDTNVMSYAFYLLIILFFTCIIALIINSRRHRRKTDRYNRSVLVLTVLSFISIILYFVLFYL